MTGYDALAAPHTRGPAPFVVKTGEKEPEPEPVSPVQPWPFPGIWPNVAPKQAQE
jgi:hypothetical protein